jgi:hypothetical protein
LHTLCILLTKCSAKKNVPLPAKQNFKPQPPAESKRGGRATTLQRRKTRRKVELPTIHKSSKHLTGKGRQSGMNVDTMLQVVWTVAKFKELMKHQVGV